MLINIITFQYLKMAWAPKLRCLLGPSIIVNIYTYGYNSYRKTGEGVKNVDKYHNFSIPKNDLGPKLRFLSTSNSSQSNAHNTRTLQINN